MRIESDGVMRTPRGAGFSSWQTWGPSTPFGFRLTPLRMTSCKEESVCLFRNRNQRRRSNEDVGATLEIGNRKIETYQLSRKAGNHFPFRCSGAGDCSLCFAGYFHIHEIGHGGSVGRDSGSGGGGAG